MKKIVTSISLLLLPLVIRAQSATQEVCSIPQWVKILANSTYWLRGQIIIILIFYVPIMTAVIVAYFLVNRKHNEARKVLGIIAIILIALLGIAVAGAASAPAIFGITLEYCPF